MISDTSLLSKLYYSKFSRRFLLSMFAIINFNFSHYYNKTIGLVLASPVLERCEKERRLVVSIFIIVSDMVL